MAYLITGLSHGSNGVVVSMFDFHRSDRGSNPGSDGYLTKHKIELYSPIN